MWITPQLMCFAIKKFDFFSSQHLILDMTTVSFIDQSAAKAFKDWLKKDEKIYKKCLAACNCKFC